MELKLIGIYCALFLTCGAGYIYDRYYSPWATERLPASHLNWFEESGGIEELHEEEDEEEVKDLKNNPIIRAEAADVLNLRIRSVSNDRIMNGESGFVYDAIDAASQVRLLRVTPGSMEFTLETFNLSDLSATSYSALSYVWGSAEHPENIHAIKVNDQNFCVRDNLLTFLVTCAHKKVGGLVFIDAICIDQLNVAERREQVKEMARIYRNATLVIAWLGVPGPLYHRSVESFSYATNTTVTRYTRLTAAQWNGFKYLSFHPYWRRVWIVQEVLLARHVTIWCGRHTFPSSVFAGTPSHATPDPRLRFSEDGRPQTVADAVLDARSPAEKIITHRERVVLRAATDPLAQGTNVGTMDEILANLRCPHARAETYHSPVPDLIHDVIRKFGGLDCTDPRDKLYGFLGIIADASRAKVDPDYSREVAYAYHQALKIGFEEIRGEYAAEPYARNAQDAYTKYLAYYCDARDAFRMEEQQSLDVLKEVVTQIASETWTLGRIAGYEPQ
ncbi:HET-domain-containing protein [Hypoxylon rubiginosum]|uniref:HET-domain-containing protein n=1 Tax=Hypoxylon rubiginosum TaxID=110542 RepID=A0ACC0D9H0_9PEZI|nr:HET-domain-containing protein [Hypoxylon rubiginosum]